jgi:hypothetical protein
MDTTNLARLGYLSANIAGDYRYTDTLEVWHNASDDTVIVTVKSSGAVGGMDGPGGATEATYQHKEVSKPGAKASEVLKMIKAVTTNGSWNFKTYGKPTKNFRWTSGGPGLNAALCSSELALARSAD